MKSFSYQKKQILFILYFYLLTEQTFSCGPGTGVSYRNGAKQLVYTRHPNFPETSKHASGPFEAPLLPNDTRLQVVFSTDVVFSSSDLEADTRKIIEVR